MPRRRLKFSQALPTAEAAKLKKFSENRQNLSYERGQLTKPDETEY